jgi:hypothetical protein
MAGQGSSSIASCCRWFWTIQALCGLTLASIRIGRLVNGWQSKWGTTNGHRVWSRFFCPVKVPSRTYKSILQFREKHPQTVTPAPPNAVVHTICSCRNAVFLGLHTRTRPSTGVNKNNFHPTSALSATTWYSIPYGHVSIKAWLFCDVLSVADALVRNFVLLRRLLRVRLLMRLLTIHRLRSVFAMLNGHCLGSLFKSLFSFGVVFRGVPVPFPFFYTPGLVHALLQSINDRVAYIELFSSLYVWHISKEG